MSIDVKLAQLRKVAEKSDAASIAISAWSVGAHIHHCCLAMMNIGKSLASSIPPSPPPKRSPLKFFVFLFGFIPRGRGKAPETVIPKADISSEALREFLDEADRAVSGLRDLDSEKWIKHHVFGPLKRDEAIRFLAIHNNHHLKIINEILAVTQSK